MSDTETMADDGSVTPPAISQVPATGVVAGMLDGHAVSLEYPLSAETAPIGASVALDQWVDAYIRNSPYSRDTGCWNRIHNAVVAIKDALATIDSKEA